MSEAKQPDLEKTRKRVVADYQRGKKPKELSDKYGVNINTVKSWIKRDAAKKNAPSKKGAGKRAQKDATKRAPGAPRGNTNALGNKGHGAPLGNTNAMKHGGYSPAYWDTLTDEEKELLLDAQYDSEQLLLDEIALLSIRERRIMLRIRKYSDSNKGQAVASVVRSETKREFADDAEREQYEAVQREKIAEGKILPGRAYQLSTRTEATYDIVHRLEESLTRCQGQKQKCIQGLHELRVARGDDGKPAPENNLLEALVAGTSGEINTDDIPELFDETESGDDLVE